MLEALSIDTLIAVFETSDDCVKLIDVDGRVVWMNGNGIERLEIDDFAAVKGCPWADFWPEEGRHEVLSATRPLVSDASRFSAFCPTARGTPKWWDVTVNPVSDGAGRPFGFLAISRDVTERERSRESLKILLAEMRHRQRNVMTTATSLLRMHGGRDPAIRDFVGDMTRRLSMLSEAMGTIAENDHRTADLGDLLDRLIRLIAGPECALKIEAAAGLELNERGVDVDVVVIGELAVNSAKHGAFLHGGGVDLIATAEGSDVSLRWRERSAASVVDRTRDGGEGLGLMERICRVNDVTFDLSWHADGPEVTLRLPSNLTQRLYASA